MIDKIYRTNDVDATLQIPVHAVMRTAGNIEVTIQSERPETASGNGQQTAWS